MEEEILIWDFLFKHFNQNEFYLVRKYLENLAKRYFEKTFEVCEIFEIKLIFLYNSKFFTATEAAIGFPVKV